MKSQDIFILLKLVSLEQQAKDNIGSGLLQPAKGYVYDWQGWELDEEQLARDFEQSQSEMYSNRGLEASTGVSKSEVNASIKRSMSVGMAKLDIIIHGIKYVYPAKPSAIARGIPTSIAAPVLEGKLMTAGEYIHVWPDALGKEKGQSIEPLYKSVPMAVRKDPRLYGFLALVDAIRLGASRESAFAAQELEKRLSA